MRRTVCIVIALALPLLAGCPMPQSSAARMQEAASDFNTNVRFGRMSLAVEKIAPTEREEFLKRRKAWGDHVQLADYELVSAKMISDDEAEVVVKYDWYDVNAGDLHVTSIRQKWQSHKGNWLLGGEAREDGAPGLFGEEMPAAPTAPRASVQFPTVRLAD